jgi:hypothetical protein
MNCPVCKYPNPTGATHCGMCYEVFNRSAAQAYLHSVKRERREKEGVPEEPEAVIHTQHVVEEIKAAAARVDWSGLGHETTSFLKKFQKVIWIPLGLVAAWLLLSFLFSASLWYHLFGKKFTYVYSTKSPTAYMVAFKSNVKSWSERRGRLDTPLEEYRTDEIGNLLLQKKRDMSKTRSIVGARAREWIQIQNDAAGSRSHSISKKHPSLAEGRLAFSPKGALLERRYALTPRMGKSLPFLSPRFPIDSLRHGRQWTEEIEWLDVYNDWQIDWTAKLLWTVGELEPCRDGTCAKLTYTAELTPHLKGGPSWVHGGVRRLEASTTAEGQALFDPSHRRLVANTFTYDGLLRIPIDTLARIPWDLRIGHGVKAPGEILIRFENKIDIQKN